MGDFSTPLRSARNDREGMGAMVFHDGRKLFANGFLSGMKPMAFHSSRKLFAKGFLSGMGAM